MASTSVTTPRTKGQRATPPGGAPLALETGRSRTTSSPDFRLTTIENDRGDRIITPSMTACPPMYGRCSVSAMATAKL
jgi:hypothetical protein